MPELHDLTVTGDKCPLCMQQLTLSGHYYEWLGQIDAAKQAVKETWDKYKEQRDRCLNEYSAA